LRHQSARRTFFTAVGLLSVLLVISASGIIAYRKHQAESQVQIAEESRDSTNRSKLRGSAIGVNFSPVPDVFAALKNTFNNWVVPPSERAGTISRNLPGKDSTSTTLIENAGARHTGKRPVGTTAPIQIDPGIFQKREATPHHPPPTN
jgi:hypothetical protein